jgi:hypothetical protein
MMKTTDDELKQVSYGIDPASPDGDYMALSIRINQEVFTYVGKEAEAITAYAESYHQSKLAEAMPEKMEQTKYLGKRHSYIQGYNNCIDAMTAALTNQSPTKGEV